MCMRTVQVSFLGKLLLSRYRYSSTIDKNIESPAPCNPRISCSCHDASPRWILTCLSCVTSHSTATPTWYAYGYCRYGYEFGTIENHPSVVDICKGNRSKSEQTLYGSRVFLPTAHGVPGMGHRDTHSRYKIWMCRRDYVQ